MKKGTNTLLRLTLGGLAGYVMGSGGLTVATWQFWVLFAIVWMLFKLRDMLILESYKEQAQPIFEAGFNAGVEALRKDIQDKLAEKQRAMEAQQ